MLFCNVKFAAEESKKSRLENNFQRGLNSAGRDKYSHIRIFECWGDCKIVRIQDHGEPEHVRSYITNPACLDDCFPPNHCVSHLLQDFKVAGGICNGSLIDTQYNSNGIWSVSDKHCELFEEDDDHNPWDIKTGLCSEKTESLLLDQKKCIHPIFSQKPVIFSTINILMKSLCTELVNDGFWPEPVTTDKSEMREPITTDKTEMKEPITTDESEMKEPITTDESEMRHKNMKSKPNPIQYVKDVNSVFNTTLESWLAIVQSHRGNGFGAVVYI